jgi:hypothetical protein
MTEISNGKTRQIIWKRQLFTGGFWPQSTVNDTSDILRISELHFNRELWVKTTTKAEYYEEQFTKL